MTVKTSKTSFFWGHVWCFIPVVRYIAILLIMIVQSSIATAASKDNGSMNPRMANAPSPYLQIHATDLVQWYPWDEEVFELARKLKRPLMVSFGYTACHWCHVMQETHFIVPDIAKLINDNFIPVIVDRERRPVLDETYMLVTEVLTNRGGWPNTVFMTPEQIPFYGTGYIPADRFRKIAKAINESWRNEREAVVAEGARLSDLLQNYMTRREEARELDAKFLSSAANELAGQFDELVGGFGGAPKFFQQSMLMFLLQQAERDGNQQALEAVELTLHSIITGGIHDHIEGGVHRYSVDPAWRVPHFEKMLYDQALMSEIFAEAYRVTGKREFANMARRIADYVLADLTAPGGGFYATRDADSEGEEGTYYVWSKQQLTDALGREDATYAINLFEQVPDGELAEKVILNLDNVSSESVARVDTILTKLASVRANRAKPRRDEKIVTSWNGMMIKALARTSLVLDEEKYAGAALRAGNFLWRNLRARDGALMRSFFAGSAEIEAELSDYAWLAQAFLELYDLSGNDQWLDRAKKLQREMEQKFADQKTGDYFSSQHAAGFARTKSRQDSDLPSANGVALGVLTALANRAGDPKLQLQVENLLAALSGFAAKNPASGASILVAADHYLRGQTGAVQYGGGGAVRALARLDEAANKLSLDIKVAKGWHINAHKPLEDYLVATRLAVKGDDVQFSYPDARTKQLGFSKTPLALLEGNLQITAEGVSAKGASISAMLEIQACSDEICLAPDTLTFTIAPPHLPE